MLFRVKYLYEKHYADYSERWIGTLSSGSVYQLNLVAYKIKVHVIQESLPNICHYFTTNSENFLHLDIGFEMKTSRCLKIN